MANALMTDAVSLAQPRLLDTRQAAAFLGISERGVHRLKAAGELPFVPVGGLVRYRPEALSAWAESAERRVA